MKPAILIVEDDRVQADILEEILQPEGFDIARVADGESALKELERRPFDLLLTDLRLPGQDGVTTLRQAKAAAPDLPVVIMTAHGTIETAIEAMKQGASDYLLKPYSKTQLLLVIHRVLEHQAWQRERLVWQEEARLRWQEGELVGQAPAMRPIFKLVERVAKETSPVLISGETGTGKELIARAIHYHSARRDRPFVAVNCAAIPESLLESELFGYERGAFTGALDRRLGKFALANHGTLFLDEVGDMPLPMQAKVLRAVQFGEFEPLGSSRPTRVDVRILAATHADLRARVHQGAFREDLWYRLNVVPVHLPPLRERPEDIPLLIQAYLERLGRGKRIAYRVRPEALDRLRRYRYPGNIRELENILERAAILSEDGQIGPQHLWFGGAPTPSSPPEDSLKGVREEAVESAERQTLADTLAAAGWNRVQAAKRLKIDYKTLRRKIAKYRLSPPAP